jgi:hypothetical protein
LTKMADACTERGTVLNHVRLLRRNRS